MSPPQLSAVLVVRDEAERLPACLRSLAGVVDEIVVHDTGSRDDTVALARAAGAVVHEGFWDDDFARARNVGLELARAPWVLVVDADESIGTQPPPDRAELLALLAAIAADVLTVAVHNTYPDELGGDYRHPGPRLLRRDVVRYVGRVHEQPVSARGGATAACPPALLTIEHTGYGDADSVRAKARRNAAIATEELARLRRGAAAAPDRLAKVLLDLGRSLVVCGRRQEAVDAFEELRAVAPGTRRALEGTDALARLLLAAGVDDAVLVLAEELREAGTDARYCDWLRAQALAQLGGTAEALELLRGVDLLRDPAGRELGLGQVLEMRALVAGLAGCDQEALACLAGAMAVHGRIAGRGALLLDLARRTAPAPLAALLADGLATLPLQRQPDRRAAIAAELAGSRPPGPEVAALVLAAGARGEVEGLACR